MQMTMTREIRPMTVPELVALRSHRQVPGTTLVHRRVRHVSTNVVVAAVSTGVGLACLVALVLVRAGATTTGFVGMQIALEVVAVAGLVFGSLFGISALSQPAGPGSRRSGLGLASVLVAVWVVALLLEIAALAKT